MAAAGTSTTAEVGTQQHAVAQPPPSFAESITKQGAKSGHQPSTTIDSVPVVPLQKTSASRGAQTSVGTVESRLPADKKITKTDEGDEGAQGASASCILITSFMLLPLLAVVGGLYLTGATSVCLKNLRNLGSENAAVFNGSATYDGCPDVEWPLEDAQQRAQSEGILGLWLVAIGLMLVQLASAVNRGSESHYAHRICSAIPDIFSWVVVPVYWIALGALLNQVILTLPCLMSDSCTFAEHEYERLLHALTTSTCV